MEKGMGMQKKWLMFVSVVIIGAGLVVVSSQAVAESSDLAKRRAFAKRTVKRYAERKEKRKRKRKASAAQDSEYCQRINEKSGWVVAVEVVEGDCEKIKGSKVLGKGYPIANPIPCYALTIDKYRYDAVGVRSERYCESFGGSSVQTWSNFERCQAKVPGAVKHFDVLWGDCRKIKDSGFDREFDEGEPASNLKIVNCYGITKRKYEGQPVIITEADCKDIGGTVKK